MLATPHGLDQIVATFGDANAPDFEAKNIVLVPLPYALVFENDAGVKSMTSHIRCHRLLAQTFQDVFADIKCKSLVERCTNYGGLFQHRNTRGASHLSCHAWGIAIDINPQTNRLGTKGDMDPGVIAVFKAHGFMWGGEFQSRLDPMHYQFATGY